PNADSSTNGITITNPNADSSTNGITITNPNADSNPDIDSSAYTITDANTACTNADRGSCWAAKWCDHNAWNSFGGPRGASGGSPLLRGG
ncbi:MAG: hypothetical protein WCK40_10290, partial [Thermoleophilia bacterium]